MEIMWKCGGIEYVGWKLGVVYGIVVE